MLGISIITAFVLGVLILVFLVSRRSPESRAWDKLWLMTPTLYQLLENLKRSRIADNPFDDLVRFFTYVQEFREEHYDDLREVFFAFSALNADGEHNNLVKSLGALLSHLLVGINNPVDGINNLTANGETPNENTITLGGIHGLESRPISHWRSETKRADFDNDQVEAIFAQSFTFLEDNVYDMTNVVEGILDQVNHHF